MSRNRNEIKIIGGKWRRHKLAFPEKAVLRPTPSRVRETLFNWLSSEIVGARCLDLFAGSGALGIESLSRGASTAVFIDKDIETCGIIKRHLEKFAARGGEVIAQEFPEISLQGQGLFDIIFLDPPYHEVTLTDVCVWLESNKFGLINKSAWVYSEWFAGKSPVFPDGWVEYKQKRYGEVEFSLHKVSLGNL